MADEEKKRVPAYPGIPSVVTPQIAQQLKAHHPRYSMYAPVVEARLRDWRIEHEPEEVAKEDKEREAAQKKAEADAKKSQAQKKEEPSAPTPAQEETTGKEGN